MKKWIENCFWIKVVSTIVTGLLFIGICAAVIVGIWCCNSKCYSNDYRNFLPAYDTGVVIVRENNTESIKRYTITHYDNLKKYTDNASTGDIAYVYNPKNTINTKALAKLCENKNIELWFMNTNAKLIINTSKKDMADDNKQ